MLRQVLILLSHLVLICRSTGDWCYNEAACDLCRQPRPLHLQASFIHWVSTDLYFHSSGIFRPLMVIPISAPSNWPVHYPYCGLYAQSPINIENTKAQFDFTLGPIQLSGSYGSSTGEITNNGHSVEVVLSSQYTLSGAGLSDTYTLAGFHLHFGSSLSLRGSEHHINGKAYPLEIHFVFYNSKYQDLTEAKTKGDGLAVIGVLFEIGVHNNVFDNFLYQLPQVAYNGQKTSVSFNIRNILPYNLWHYYKYQGSLTTPTCSENVTWFVLGSIQQLSLSQYEQVVTSLYFTTPDALEPIPMINNFRPIQPTNGRRIVQYQ